MDEPEDLVNYVQVPNLFDGDATIGVSLSGGGYRATVFSLGALTALHDAGVWESIRWIASVSGGSFVNAAAAVRLPPTPTSADFDRLIREVVATVTSRWTLIGCRRTDRSSPDRGLVAKMYTAGIQRSWTAAHDGSQPRLVDIARGDRIHAFMATDLASSTPVALADRLIFSEGMEDELQLAHRPGQVSLATAVRASATFPGMPAVRLRPEELGEALEPSDNDLFLVDGGAWNNLGTDWGRAAQWFDRAQVLPPGIPRQVNMHVVVDASAPPRRPKPWWTGRHPLAYDASGLTVLRAFRVAVHSIVRAQRTDLRTGAQTVGPVALVDLDGWPQNISERSALVTGKTANEWLAVSKRNKRVATIAPTVLGLEKDAAVELLAHAHAQMHAHLTTVGVPYDSIGRSFDRFEGVLQ